MNQSRKKILKNQLAKSVLDNSSLVYYSRVFHTLDEVCDNNEEKNTLISNALDQLKDDALLVSQNNIGSKLIEKLLTHANIDQFVGIARCMSNNWEVCVTNRFASFTLQCIIRNSSNFFSAVHRNMQKSEFEFEKLQDELKLILASDLVCYVNSQLAFFMQHSSASHIIRAIIELLSCRRFDDQIIYEKQNISNKICPKSDITYPSKIKRFFQEQLLNLDNKLVSLSKLQDHVCNTLSNPVLQSMVLSLKSLPVNVSSELLSNFIEKSELFTEHVDKKLLVVSEKEIGSYLLEQVLITLSDDRFEEIFSLHFKGKLLLMATSPIGNFVLQRLIKSSRNKKQFKQIYEELLPHFESIFALNHLGVIVEISRACQLHSTKQTKFVKHLCKAFHCYEPEARRCKFVQLLLSLSTYEVFFSYDDDKNKVCKSPGTSKNDYSKKGDMLCLETDDEIKTGDDEMSSLLPKLQFVNIYGSQIMQNLLMFKNVALVVQGLFELSFEELKLLCEDARGTRVIEAFLESTSVSDKLKNAYALKLKKLYLPLSCSKWGSRTFDAIWKSVNMEAKEYIVSELAQNSNKLRENRYGVFIFNKCQVDVYRQNRQAWLKSIGKTLKRKRSYTELVF